MSMMFPDLGRMLSTLMRSVRPPERISVSQSAVKYRYLGKAVRFYLSTQSEGCLHYKKTLNRVPKSFGARPLMQFEVDPAGDEKAPYAMPRDVDFAAYVREARQILIDIAAVEDVVGEAPKKPRKAVSA